MRPLNTIHDNYSTPLPPALDISHTQIGDSPPTPAAGYTIATTHQAHDAESIDAAARHVFNLPAANSAADTTNEPVAAVVAPPRHYTDAEKRDVLRSLGVSEKHLKKTKGAKLDAAFQQAMGALQSPGQHKLTLSLDKKYELKVRVGADGEVMSAQATQKKGFFGKIVGVLKMAVSVAGILLAPVTGGLSLVASAAFGAIDAIKNKNWLGAIASAAGAFVPGAGAVLGKTIASVAGVVQKAAYAVQGAMTAIKAKSAGAFLGAVAAGVGAVAGATGRAAGKLAEVGGKIQKYAGYVQSGEAAIQAARRRDFLGAASGAMGAAAGLAKGGAQDTLIRAAGWVGGASAVQRGVRTGDYTGVASALTEQVMAEHGRAQAKGAEKRYAAPQPQDAKQVGAKATSTLTSAAAPKLNPTLPAIDAQRLASITPALLPPHVVPLPPASARNATTVKLGAPPPPPPPPQRASTTATRAEEARRAAEAKAAATKQTTKESQAAQANKAAGAKIVPSLPVIRPADAATNDAALSRLLTTDVRAMRDGGGDGAPHVIPYSVPLPKDNDPRAIRDAILKEKLGYDEKDIKALDKRAGGTGFYITNGKEGGALRWATREEVSGFARTADGQARIDLDAGLVRDLTAYRAARAATAGIDDKVREAVIGRLLPVMSGGEGVGRVRAGVELSEAARGDATLAQALRRAADTPEGRASAGVQIAAARLEVAQAGGTNNKTAEEARARATAAVQVVSNRDREEAALVNRYAAQVLSAAGDKAGAAYHERLGRYYEADDLERRTSTLSGATISQWKEPADGSAIMRAPTPEEQRLREFDRGQVAPPDAPERDAAFEKAQNAKRTTHSLWDTGTNQRRTQTEEDKGGVYTGTSRRTASGSATQVNTGTTQQVNPRGVERGERYAGAVDLVDMVLKYYGLHQKTEEIIARNAAREPLARAAQASTRYPVPPKPQQVDAIADRLERALGTTDDPQAKARIKEALRYMPKLKESSRAFWNE